MEHATPGFSDAGHKDRPSAALIGLAISMGASSLIVPQQGDAAYATEPAVPELTRVILYTPDLIPASQSGTPQEKLAATELTPTVPVRESFNAGVQVKFKDLIQSSGKLADQPALKTVVPRVADKTESPATVLPAAAITTQPAPAVLTVPVVEVTPNIVLHKVQPGETLSSIASAYGVSLTELLKFNELSDPSRLEINQTLNIPQTSAIRSDFSETASDESSNQSVAGTTLAASSTSIASGYANSLASQSEQPNQKYVENLRADLMRLREKYQVHKDRNQAHLPAQEAQDAQQVVVPAQRNRSVSASGFSANSNTSQAQIQKLREQQRELASKTQSSAWETAVAESTIEPQQIAKASLGSELYESLMNPLMNSPQLPPLNSPDTYLPKSPAYSNGYNWPAQGVLTSGYGWRWGRMHAGIDIAGPIGTPIVAAASGVVTYAGWDEGGYGNLVEIQHPDGSMTRYAHNDRILVRQGQQVEQGEQISEMGSTGFSTGPHLHFEIHHPGGGAQNPMAYLPPA